MIETWRSGEEARLTEASMGLPDDGLTPEELHSALLSAIRMESNNGKARASWLS